MHAFLWQDQNQNHDHWSLRSCCFKEANESTLRKDLLVVLVHHDPSDLGSLIPIWIIPKECTLKYMWFKLLLRIIWSRGYCHVVLNSSVLDWCSEDDLSLILEWLGEGLGQIILKPSGLIRWVLTTTSIVLWSNIWENKSFCSSDKLMMSNFTVIVSIMQGVSRKNISGMSKNVLMDQTLQNMHGHSTIT